MKNDMCLDTLLLTFKMIVTHIGTISFGHVLAYNPEIVNTILGKI